MSGEHDARQGHVSLLKRMAVGWVFLFLILEGRHDNGSRPGHSGLQWWWWGKTRVVKEGKGKERVVGKREREREREREERRGRRKERVGEMTPSKR